MSLEIESSDVIRIVEQFLKENNLLRTLEVLQEESSVSLNTIDSIEAFQSEILQGHWDSVLSQVKRLKISNRCSMDLYEQVTLELIELREIGAARSLLRQTDAMMMLKAKYPERYVHLENLLARNYYDPREAYPESNKEKRRQYIATQLCKEVSVVAPGRMLTLINQALKYQQSQGLLPPSGTKIDLFRGKVKHFIDAKDDQQEDLIPTSSVKDLKFNEDSHAEVAKFSPDGQYFITGSYDGFIEVWSYLGKLRKDLKYQAKDELMSHDYPILALNYTNDSEMLASGDAHGCIKVWKISDGRCLRKVQHAHTKGVTSIQFTKDNGQVISASYDMTIRLHGLRSGKMMREFRGHESFVTSAFLTPDNQHIVSSGADACCKVWNFKTGECVNTIRIGGDQSVHSDIPVNQVIQHPKSSDKLIICNRTSIIHVTDRRGTVLYSFASGKPVGDIDTAFVSITVSPKGDWLYGVAEDGLLYAFSISTGKLERTLKAIPDLKKKLIGISHHPDINLLTTFDLSGTVKFWKP